MVRDASNIAPILKKSSEAAGSDGIIEPFNRRRIDAALSQLHCQAYGVASIQDDDFLVRKIDDDVVAGKGHCL